MSRYSGKCDLADHIEIFGINHILNSDVYIGDSETPLKLTCYEDLIPYLPYIIGLSVRGKEKSYMRLSSESWVDREERDTLEFYKKRLVRIYKRCKRKHEIYDVNKAQNEVCFLITPKAVKELARRVGEKGQKAELDGLHLESCEYYRRNLVKEMLAHGINPAEYGYGRFLTNAEKEF